MTFIIKHDDLYRMISNLKIGIEERTYQTRLKKLVFCPSTTSIIRRDDFYRKIYNLNLAGWWKCYLDSLMLGSCGKKIKLNGPRFFALLYSIIEAFLILRGFG